MRVLVDSSVWIEYFRGSEKEQRLDFLIEDDLVVVNSLILAELLPALHVRKQYRLEALMREITCIPFEIDWDDIVMIQIECIRNGINKVGIPDLLIAQQAIRNHVDLYSLDKHFSLIAKHMPLSLF